MTLSFARKMVWVTTFVSVLTSLVLLAGPIEFQEVEDRAGWSLETVGIAHGVRINRRVWLEDATKISYQIWIEGKHLWTVDFSQQGVFYTPVQIDGFEQIITHLDVNEDRKQILDFLTPDQTGYIASLTFDEKTRSVIVASEADLVKRAEVLGWKQTKLYQGPDFSDPKSVYVPRLPKIALPK